MGEYSTEMDKMVFSFSKCHTFENCKYEWYLNYLLRDENGKPVYENEQNFYAAFGGYCHNILERILKKEITVEEGFEYYKSNFEETMMDFDVQDSTMDKYYFFGYDYFSNLSFDWLEDYDVLGIEKECRFSIDGINFVGYIDLEIRDKKTGNIIIIDHKSAEYPLGKKGTVLKRKKEDYESYKRQLYLYCRQVYDEYGVYPKYLVWNYFRDSKWLSIPFDYNEYKDTEMWAIELVNKIKSEEEFLPRLEDNFFYCNNLCGFRNSCDYKTMGSE